MKTRSNACCPVLPAASRTGRRRHRGLGPRGSSFGETRGARGRRGSRQRQRRASVETYLMVATTMVQRRDAPRSSNAACRWLEMQLPARDWASPLSRDLVCAADREVWRRFGGVEATSRRSACLSAAPSRRAGQRGRRCEEGGEAAIRKPPRCQGGELWGLFSSASLNWLFRERRGVVRRKVMAS